jgi:long-chain fatty acid transport protein
MRLKTVTREILIGLMASAGALAPAVASATNGYFSHGYGMKAKGMAGAGVAYPQDALAAATNPAGMALVGDRLDVGIEYFRPVREATISGTGFSDGTFESGNKDFYIPEFGYNRMVTPNMAVGVSVYGNGGMNTSYPNIPLLDGSGTYEAGVNLEQLIIAPTLAFKPTPKQAIGISLNLLAQRFEAKGLQNFATPSSSVDPTHVTDNGESYSYGAGVRLGWTGQVTSRLSLGATYASKIEASELDDYSGLFPEQGKFDLPANYAVGLAFKATPKLNIAFDVERIEYSDAAVTGNPIQNLFAGNRLGSENGPGWGWTDQTVYKLGVDYAWSPKTLLRAGWNYGEVPIPEDQVMFNIISPATVEHHLTLGATHKIGNDKELTWSYMHAFEKEVDGPGSIPGELFGSPSNADAKIKMYEDSFGVALGWKF